MKCKCGKAVAVYYKGENLCWNCYDKVPGTGARKEDNAVSGLIHIDTYVNKTDRVRMCGGPGDETHHMTPSIAAAFIAQHPTDALRRMCAMCHVQLQLYYHDELTQARAYAATLP